MRSRPDDHAPRLPRRRFLAGALRVTVAGLTVPALDGCAPEQEDGKMLRVDVSGLVPGERLVVERGEFPVELRSTNEGIQARSLLCTHQGCVVRWVESERQYVCPCHEARFDEHGEPLHGPAKRPLRALRVVGDRNEVQVDLRPTEA